MNTTPYFITVAPAARRQLLALPTKQAKLIVKYIESLAINPRPPGVKKIEGMTGLCSQEIENTRIIYKVEEQEVLLLLIK